MATQAMSGALAPAAIPTRIIAYVLDAIVLAVVGIVIVGTLYNDASVVGSVVRAIVYAIIGYGYFGYSWTAWRASPGQRLFGLITVNEADGSTLTWNQATRRWLYLFGPSVLNSVLASTNGLGALSSLVGLIVFAYYVYLLWTTTQDPRHQGFHDKQSSTIVAVKSA